MFLSTHILVPLATETLLAKKKLIKLTKGLLVSTVIGALLPDVDLFFASPITKHHQTLFHAPLVWLAILLGGVLLAKLFKKVEFISLIAAFSFGTLSHMVLDTFGVAIGIAWLAPFSWQEYSFTPLTAVTEETWIRIYLGSKVFLAEAITTLIILFLFVKKRTRAFPVNSLQ